MRASILGFLVAILLLAGFGLPVRTSPDAVQRGWPWRVYAVEFADGAFTKRWHIHYLLVYVLVSVGSGFGTAWLVRHLFTAHQVA